MASAEFEARFRDLQQQFLQRMQADQPKIEQLLADMRNPVAYEEHLKAFYTLVHRYSGSGQTFGFPVITEIATTLEAKLQEFSNQQELLSHLHEIELLTKALIESFAQALQSLQ